MAHVTDYDVWHEEEEAVSVQMLIDNLRANAALSKKTIAHLVGLLPEDRTCECGQALSTALITDREFISKDKIKQLRPIVGRYF
jgi:5'-methylthioadenosine phosphorylase